MSAQAVNPSFEALHPRGRGGLFAAKTNTAPSGSLTGTTPAWATTAYRGEPVTQRTQEPSPLIIDDTFHHPGLVSPAVVFAEEHQLADGRYLTSIHRSFVLADTDTHPVTEPDTEQADGAPGGGYRLVLESEQFVCDRPGAAWGAGHQPRTEEGAATVARLVDERRWPSLPEATAAARQVAENTFIYQKWFNKDPFAGSFRDEHTDAFVEALPMIRVNEGFEQ